MNRQHPTFQHLSLDPRWEKLDRLYEEAETSRLLATIREQSTWSWRDFGHRLLRRLQRGRPLTSTPVERRTGGTSLQD